MRNSSMVEWELWSNKYEEATKGTNFILIEIFSSMALHIVFSWYTNRILCLILIISYINFNLL